MKKRLQAPLVELLILIRRLLAEQKILNPHLLAEQKTRKQSKRARRQFRMS